MTIVVLAGRHTNEVQYVSAHKTNLSLSVARHTYADPRLTENGFREIGLSLVTNVTEFPGIGLSLEAMEISNRPVP